MNPDRCIQCNEPSIKVKLITGDELEHWCEEHLKYAQKLAVADLGKEIFNFIFSDFKYNLWFWGEDIKIALSDAIINYFTERSRDLYDIGDDTKLAQIIQDCAQILVIKAREYQGAIEMSKLGSVENIQMLSMYVTENYIKNISGPLGPETQKVALNKIKYVLENKILLHLICIILAAKRAERYVGHKYENILTAIEIAVWQSHMQHLK